MEHCGCRYPRLTGVVARTPPSKGTTRQATRATWSLVRIRSGTTSRSTMTAGDHLATVHVGRRRPVEQHADLPGDVDGLPVRRRDRVGAPQAGSTNPRPPVSTCAPSGHHASRVVAEGRPRVPLSGRAGATGRSSAQGARSTPSWRLPLGGHAPPAAGHPGDRPQPRISRGALHGRAPYAPSGRRYAPTTRGQPRGRERALTLRQLHARASCCHRRNDPGVRDSVVALPALCVAATVPVACARLIATPHVLAAA
jgi:hypothetical protein